MQIARVAATGALVLGSVIAGSGTGTAGAAATASTTPPSGSCGRPASTVLYRTPTRRVKTIALTFDDGPSAYTKQVLAVLRKYRVHATFFETGLHVSARPDLTRAVVAAGNRVGNHTWSHPQEVPGSSPYGHFDALDAATQAAQIDSTTSAIVHAAGTRPCFFRAPGGADAAALTSTLVTGRGMSLTHWSISSGDSGQPGHASASAVKWIVRNATHDPGRHPILLMHDGKASPEPEAEVSRYRGNTVAALPRILRWYRSRHYVFVDPAGHRF
jgi:peptidoglycan/xylan/chitin deacetylase (PgdA/CDA1 family)